MTPTFAVEPWLLVDTKKDQLTVMGETGPLEVFANIALGVRGAGIKKKRGDETTPLGSFKVTRINPSSRFRLFFELDYPNLEYAKLAYWEKRISKPVYQSIVGALEAGRAPPQNTPLGGYIGIHGVGPGSAKVHRIFNWTNGCIALNNEQIVRLRNWVKVGTRVEIR